MVTVLGPDASQVDYRLSPQCGHDEATAADAALTYRLAMATGARPIERIGGGWAEHGHTPGPDSVLVDEDDIEQVRTVMAGRDPHTGEWLVRPKMAVHPAAKLPAAPLVQAIHAAAEQAGHPAHELLESEQAKRFARLERGLHRDGDAHRAPVGDLKPLAAAAGVDIAGVYGHQELEQALAHRDERVRVGNRGYDVTLDMPKSVSVLWGLADEQTAGRVEELYLQAVRESVSALEGWTAYGMAGHHGDGQRAETLATSGFAGTITLHRTARPVDGQAGDPHLHAHVMLANLVRCEDGTWRTVAAGGRDLHRHVAAIGELARARVRDLLSRELGVAWEQSPDTGRWEIVGINAEVRRLYSSRHRQIDDKAGKNASTAERDTVARRNADAKQDLSPAEERAAWHERAIEAHLSPTRLVADATGREPPEARTDPHGPRPPQRPDPETIAAAVWDPETGITAGTKTVTRARVLAAVAGACPGGLQSAQELEDLTDTVLADERAVAMPETGPTHMANATRYTTRDVLTAEQQVIDAATRRRDAEVARVAPASAAEAIAAFEQRKGFALSAEQRAVVDRLLSAGHGLDAVIGVAGSGKTTIMAAARSGWEAQGLRVAGASTAAVAAAGLRAEAGIDSRTIAAWTQRIARGHGLAGIDVLVIDEAAMVDDRALAALTEAAETAGTKLVGIGDPQQLHAVGIGGSFARVHQVVEGLELSENRRQRGDVDRAALEQWRHGGRRTALATWGQHGRVHVGADAETAYEAIAAAWWADRQPIAEAHDAVNDVLVLAATNADAEELNARCRSIARDQGMLGEDVTYRTTNGGRLALATGDQVRIRANDYRSRREAEEPDVLNGYRGLVLQTDQRRGVLVEWRHAGNTEQAWMDPEAIAAGALSHAYAATIASAQGQTSERAHIYGTGADARALYPAMSRAREATHLYLPGVDDLESPETRAASGPPRSAEEEQNRAIAAYAASLRDADEPIALDELTGTPYGLDPEHEQDTVQAETSAPEEARPEPAAEAPAEERDQEPQHEGSPEAEPEVPEEDVWQPLSRADAYAGRGPAATAARERLEADRAALVSARERLPALRSAYAAADQHAEQGRLRLWMAGSSRRQADQERDQARAELDETQGEVWRLQQHTGLWKAAITTDLRQAIADDHELEMRDQEHVLGLSRDELQQRPMEERRAEVEGIRARDAAQVVSTGGPVHHQGPQRGVEHDSAHPTHRRQAHRPEREREGPELGL